MSAQIIGNIGQYFNGYTVLERPELTVDLLTGARFYDLLVRAGLEEGILKARSVEGSSAWLDAVAAAQLDWRPADRWHVHVRADVGTGGSNLTWQGYLVGAYDFKWGSMVAGWRHLYIDHGSAALRLKLTLAGPLVGARFTFWRGGPAYPTRPLVLWEVAVTRPPRPLLVLLLLAGAWPGRALAGPPYLTDDPEPVELHHWELYLAAQVSSRPGAGAAGTCPHVEVNFGAAPELQLHLIAPLAWSRSPGGATQRGYGDTELGAKYRFLQEGEWAPQVGLFPLLQLPTGSAAQGLGAGHVQLVLPLWLQKRFGAWTTYGGGGYTFNRGQGSRDGWSAGWQVQRTLQEGVALGAELFHRSALDVGASAETRYDLGLVLDFGELHHLLLSAGSGLGGGYQAYLAYQLTVGPGPP